MKPQEAFQGWESDELPEICGQFQVDLSCLVDGELDEVSATRAMFHLEVCDSCNSFFQDTRDCLRMHRDVVDPERLMARVAMLTGTDFQEEAESIASVSQLATIFYKLGKAYILMAIDPDWRTRVFEKAVPVEPTQSNGRRFVDEVLEKGGGRLGGVDWQEARHWLNGRLAEIESPLEKGRRLLNEALEADPSHEEARIYLAFLHRKEGKTLKAAEQYRRVFRMAIEESNRGHAAVQLGLLHASQEDYRKAIACFRWVTASGLAERDERFFFVRFNIGMDYAFLGDGERSVAAFRDLLDRHPGRLDEVVDLFARSDRLRESIDTEPEFANHLLTTCPELFDMPDPDTVAPSAEPW